MVDGDAQLSPALPQSRAHLPVATQDEHRSKAAIATGDERPGFVRLAIKCPSLHQDPAVLSIRSSSSIRQVKAHIEQTWEGRPRVDGMRVIRAGRIVGDEEIVKDVIAGTDPNEAASLHLVIRPDAWSEPPARGHHGPRKAPGSPDAGKAPGRSPFSSNATFLDPLESTPYFGPPPPAPSTTFAPSSSNRDATSERSTPEQRLAALFETLEPSQGPTLKALFLTAQEFYLHLYEVTWHELYGPTVADTRPSTSNMSEQDAAEMEQSVKMLSEDVLGLPSLLSINDLPPIQRDTTLPTSSYIHQQTTIHGLPYLLQVPVSLEFEAKNAWLQALHSRITLLRDLSGKIDRLISYQALFDLTTRAGSSTMAASFARRATTASAEATASTGHDQARQRRPGLQTLLFVINLDELFHIALPLFFLSFKLSILLYVFTRHASPFKRYCLISLAVLYVVYEGYSMVQRRARLRETADRLRRAAEDGQRNRRAPSANGNGDTAPEGAQPTADAPASNQETQQGDTPARPAGANVPHAESSVPDPNAPPPPPRAPARYTATSPLVLNYWIEHVAYIGLEDEDVELGLQLPGGGGAATRAFTPRGYWTYKVFARVIVPLILFVGTLVPEIEKRRRKAIEEREHVIRTVARIEEERQARLAEERERASGQDGQNTSVTATAVNGAPTEGASSTSAEHSATLSGATEQPAGRPLLHSEYSERVLRRRGAAGREFERDPLDVAAEADADEFAEDDLGFF